MPLAPGDVSCALAPSVLSHSCQSPFPANVLAPMATGRAPPWHLAHTWDVPQPPPSVSLRVPDAAVPLWCHRAVPVPGPLSALS